jgi:shikimate dehydrogenase
MPLQFAVIGNPIEHSRSPDIHHLFGQETGISLNYIKILSKEADFESQVNDFFIQGGQGLNVTLPFKQRAYVMAKNHTPRCQAAKAANTLWMNERQELCADNTDGVGLVRDLSRHIQLPGSHILILGAGGAARGIINPLLEQGLSQLTIANRTEETLAALKDDFPVIECMGLDTLSGNYTLIINTTSAGYTGGFIQLPADILATSPLCYDLSYNLKEPTPFVHYARANGCQAVDGFGMLVEQAAESFYIWHRVLPSADGVLREFQ